MVDNSLLIIVFLWSGLALGGCAGNMPAKDKVSADKLSAQLNHKVVWADDGSQVAVVTVKNEEKPDNSSNSATNKRHQHQILVQNLDGSGQHTITGWRDYQNGQIFYMKQAGYFVVESILPKGARRFDKIEENGDEILIIETPDNEHQSCQEKNSAQVYHSVIPSPDGLLLAHIYSPECGKVTVEFLHANNLNIFDTQTMDIDKPMKATWHPDGYVILATHNKAWQITALAPLQPIAPPRCFSPVTTSSEVSVDGKMVYFERDKLVTKNVDRQKAFGCQ